MTKDMLLEALREIQKYIVDGGIFNGAVTLSGLIQEIEQVGLQAAPPYAELAA